MRNCLKAPRPCRLAEPSPNPETTTAAPRKRRTGRWIAATVALIATLQITPSLLIVFQRDLAGSFDWPGYIAYQLGTLVVPLALGCLGLLFRRNPGLGYFIVAFSVFLFSSLGALTR